MVGLSRLRPQGCRCFALLALLPLLGCSASDIRIAPPDAGGSATVEVSVVDVDMGDVLAVDATVIAGGERATLAAGDDSVRITNVPFGDNDPPTQPLTVTAQGYTTHFEELQLAAMGTTTVDVELEQADLDISGTLTGTVTNLDSSNPVANVIVSFTPDIGGSPAAIKGGTDKEGKYIIGGVLTGTTVAKAVAQGFLPAEETIVVVQDAGGGQNSPLDFELVPTSSKALVRGTLVDLITREPIEGASVEVGGEGPELTDAKGRFEITQVPVGNQTLSVSADEYDPFSETISVLPGMPSLQVELAPTQAKPPPGPATIRGTVTIRNRPDNSGATVKAVDVDTEKVIDATVTNEAGEYGLFVPPGRYRIEVSYQGATISKTVTLPGGGRTLTGVDFQITAP